jgi:CRISPR system Cascade subunit CasA
MPRRLRLIADGEGVVGVAQKPYGANYSGWVHPLTPYYRIKAGAELLPRHPRAGPFGYRNWLGIVAGRPSGHDGTANRAAVVDLWQVRDGRHVRILVAGWAMDNMKPRDFVFSRAPLITLNDADAQRMEALVEAADKFATALRNALTIPLAEGEARENAREDFYIRTQAPFEARLQSLQSKVQDWPAIAKGWVSDLKDVAIAMFDAAAVPGLTDRDIEAQRDIIDARRALTGAFIGYGKLGREAFDALELAVPEQGGKKKKGKAA